MNEVCWKYSFLSLTIGYYTCVEVIFTLRRQVGFYMMGVYAPTLLIVVLSWLSFWINPDASAARVPLGTNSHQLKQEVWWWVETNQGILHCQIMCVVIHFTYYVPKMLLKSESVSKISLCLNLYVKDIEMVLSVSCPQVSCLSCRSLLSARLWGLNCRKSPMWRQSISGWWPACFLALPLWWSMLWFRYVWLCTWQCLCTVEMLAWIHVLDFVSNH